MLNYMGMSVSISPECFDVTISDGENEVHLHAYLALVLRAYLSANHVNLTEMADGEIVTEAALKRAEQRAIMRVEDMRGRMLPAKEEAVIGEADAFSVLTVEAVRRIGEVAVAVMAEASNTLPDKSEMPF